MSTATAKPKRLRDGQRVNGQNIVAARTHGGSIEEVRIDAIKHHIDNHRHAALHSQVKLDALAASMGERGLLQPVLVCEVKSIGKKETYCLVYGHRRLAAAKQLGWETIRAEIAPAMSDRDVLLERAIENLHREDLNPMEQVTAVEQAVDSIGGDAKAVAKQLGVTVEFVRDRLHLAQGLGEKAKAAAYAGLLGLGHLRELVKIRDRQSQNDIVEGLTEPDWQGTEPRIPTVEAVRREVQVELNDLGKVPWRLDVDFAGKRPCRSCPSNTSSQPDLFGDEFTGHCTDRQCFAAKDKAARNLADAAADRLVKLKVDKVGKAEVKQVFDAMQAEGIETGSIDAAGIAPQVRSRVVIQRPPRRSSSKQKLTPLQKAIEQYGQKVRGWETKATTAIAKRAEQDTMAEIVVRLVIATKAWEGLPRTDTGYAAPHGHGSPTAPKPTKPLNKQTKLVIAAATIAMNPDAEWFSRLTELRVLAKLPTCNLNSWHMSGNLMNCGNVPALRALAGALRVEPKLPDPPDWETFKAKAEAKPKTPAKKTARKKAKRNTKKAAAAATPKQRAAAKKAPSKKKAAR
ncbi:ParB/RepB/Spo0J family partition protein [Phycisphaerales bacterium AB-hyl4]|uniref:ParB/RepB/Spo0J family partition protein n=1 Tax=Natronomicrosphaera hydrolytica TaxID=3242702 RepID=A0ABV4U6R5_9BACT